MLRVYAKPFLEVLARLSYMQGLFQGFKHPPENPLLEENKPDFRVCIQRIRDCCDELKLDFTAMLIDRIKQDFDSPTYRIRSVITDISALEESVVNEMSTVVFLTIPFSKTDYLENKQPFGEHVFNHFSSANFDIEEAGKCFASARYTACVMHLQRVLEVALKSYATLLGAMQLITTPQPSWQVVLQTTAKEIRDRNDRQNTSKNWISNEEKEFCESVQPFLEAVKTAWRNPSMHVDKMYLEEIAEDIYIATRRFMKQLAEHLNEKGKFQKKPRK